MPYKKWAELIGVDYYSAFIKAWIALNSWYRIQPSYKSLNDGQVIDALKNANNDYYYSIKKLLEHNENFQLDVSQLHVALKNSSIRTQERGGIEKEISFSEIPIVNQRNICCGKYGGSSYKIERKSDEVTTKILNAKNEIIFSATQVKYDEIGLKNYNENSYNFSNLSTQRQGQCLAFYKTVDMYSYKSVLSSSFDGEKEKPKDEFTSLGGTAFVESKDEITVAIIEILYLIRCSLMHGDITPSKSNSAVYESGYSLLSKIIENMFLN